MCVHSEDITVKCIVISGYVYGVRLQTKVWVNQDTFCMIMNERSNQFLWNYNTSIIAMFTKL